MIKKNQLSFESERAVIKHKQTGAREINDSDKKKFLLEILLKIIKIKCVLPV